MSNFVVFLKVTHIPENLSTGKTWKRDVLMYCPEMTLKIVIGSELFLALRTVESLSRVYFLMESLSRHRLEMSVAVLTGVHLHCSYMRLSMSMECTGVWSATVKQ